MATQRVNFFQRDTGGAPLTAGVITTSSRYDDNTAGPVIGNAVELSAANQPGFYYFDVDVASTKRLTVVTDAAAVTGDNRYNSFVLDDIDPTARNIANQTWDTTTASHATAGTFGLALGTTLQTTLAALPAGTADAVWDESAAAHVSGGSFGVILGVALPSSISAVPGGVWDVATAGHVTAGTFGEFVQFISLNTWQIAATTFGGPPGPNMGEYTVYVGGLVEQTPDLVWDVDLASHVNSGSTGEALNDLATGSTPVAVATAVWSALVASNQAVGSFGEAVTILQALSHRNWRLTGATYSGSPARLTSATLVLYPTKADALASTNAILTQAFTATYDSNGEMTASLQTDL